MSQFKANGPREAVRAAHVIGFADVPGGVRATCSCGTWESRRYEARKHARVEWVEHRRGAVEGSA